MIHISRPIIRNEGEKYYLISNIKDEKRDIDSELWFSVDKEYGKYLCDDFADSFLLGILPIAVKTGQDISVEGAVSEKLLYNILTGIEPAFQRIFSQKGRIGITTTEHKNITYSNKGVATGCSLGVDSMSAIYRHLDYTNNGGGYKLTHLTLFNSGQLGDYDLEASEQNFLHTIEEIKPFAEKLGLPVLAINGNLNFFYKDVGIVLTQTFPMRTVAFALAVQKLLGLYIMASAIPVYRISFSTIHADFQDAALLPLMGTENLTVYVGDPYVNRVEKTAYIIKKPYVPQFLKVCWAEQTAFEVWHNTTFLEGKTKVNCGWCDKCLRTLLAIEVLQNGDLSGYANQFELKKYYEHRNRFIRKIFRQQNKNIFYDELVNLILEKNYRNLPKGVLGFYKTKETLRKFGRFAKKCFGAVIHPRSILGKLKRMLK